MVMTAMPPITPPTIAPVLLFFAPAGGPGWVEGVLAAVVVDVGGATDSGPTCAWARLRSKLSFAYGCARGIYVSLHLAE